MKRRKRRKTSQVKTSKRDSRQSGSAPSPARPGGQQRRLRQRRPALRRRGPRHGLAQGNSGQGSPAKSNHRKEPAWKRNAIDPNSLPVAKTLRGTSSGQSTVNKVISTNIPLSSDQLSRLHDHGLLKPSRQGDHTSRRQSRRRRESASVTNEEASLETKPPRLRELRERIRSVKVPGRPVPRSTSSQILFGELKIRLALTTPVLRETIDSDGLFHVKADSRVNRTHVTMYAITKADDIMYKHDVKLTQPSLKMARPVTMEDANNCNSNDATLAGTSCSVM